MKAWVFGGMLVLSAALAACSSSGSDGAGGGGTGGSGAGGGDEGGSSGVGSPTTATGTSTSTGTGSPTTTTTTGTTTTGGACTVGEFFGEPTCDACLNDNCCSELEACIADFQAGGTDCVDETGAFTEGPLANDVFACLEANCAEECGGGGICDSGLSVNDPAVDSCLGDACCDEFNACTQNGADTQACIDCFNSEAGGPLCDAALACAEESGCFEGGGGGICDSGLTSGDAATDECLGTNCCAEHQACTANGADVDSCVACFEAGGGALCDDAIACGEENCAG